MNTKIKLITWTTLFVTVHNCVYTALTQTQVAWYGGGKRVGWKFNLQLPKSLHSTSFCLVLQSQLSLNCKKNVLYKLLSKTFSHAMSNKDKTQTLIYHCESRHNNYSTGVSESNYEWLSIVYTIYFKNWTASHEKNILYTHNYYELQIKYKLAYKNHWF